MEVEREKTTVIIPPDPAFDQTYWDVSAPSAVRIKIQVLVERVWWSLGKEASSFPVNMSDEPIAVSRDAFAATSDAILKIWFPRPRWANLVLLGFEESRRRGYQVEVTKRDLSIPLREFWSAEIEDRTQQAELRLWVAGENTNGLGIVVCVAAPEHQQLPVSIETSAVAMESEINVDSAQMRCCSTCDHAKRRPDRVNAFKCMRQHWAALSERAFQREYSCYVCPEWQGEYYDPEGSYHSK